MSTSDNTTPPEGTRSPSNSEAQHNEVPPPLATGRASGAVRGGNSTNHLRADCLGSELTLYANGQRVLQAEDSDFKSGQIGLYTAQDEEELDVLFDNVLVSTP